MNDIRLVLKPEIDTSDVNKSIDKVAENSATALKKAYSDLASTLGNATKDFGKNFDISDTLDKTMVQARKFVGQFAKVSTTILDTGKLPEGIDTKMYKLLSEVYRISKAYNEAYLSARKFVDVNAEKIPTGKYAEISSQLSTIDRQVKATSSSIKGLNDSLKALRKIESLENSVAGGKAALEQYEQRLATIERLRENVERLRNEGKGKFIDFFGQPLTADIQGAITGPAQDAFMDTFNKAQKELANHERALRTTRAEVKRTYEEIQKLGTVAGASYTGQKGDIEAVIGKLKEERAELERLERTQSELRTQRDVIPESERYDVDFKTDDDKQEFGEMLDVIRKLKEELVVASTRVNEIGTNAEKTKVSFSQWRNVVWSVSRVLGNIYTLGLDIVRGAKTIANFYKKIWSYVQKAVAWFKKLGTAIKGTADEHKKAFTQMLKDIVRYTFGIRSLFMLFRRLRSAIKDAFSAMAEQIPEVNQMLSGLVSSVNLVKGSLATALEPILSAISGWLNIILEKLATVIQYIGMFFAALSGRDYVYKANKSMASFADTTGKAAKEAKELNKQLQGFDELNNLTTNENKDNDSGAGGGGPLATYKKAEIPEWIKNLADKIKDFLKQLWDPIKRAWDKVGDYVVGAWKRAFNSVKDLLHDIIRDFLRAWKELGESIATNFFLIIGDIGHIIANIADALRDAWNYLDNGYKIWKAILTIVNVILAGIRRITKDIRDWTATLDLRPVMTAFRKWLESLIPIAQLLMNILFDIWDKALKPIANWAINGEGSGLQRFFDMLTAFNDSLEKGKIEEDLNKIWEAIGRFGINIGEGLLEFMDRMLGYLSEWLNSDDFTEWCESVAEFLDGLDPTELADDLEQIFRIIKNIAEWVWKTIKYVIDHKDEILDALEWISEHLDTVAKTAVFGKLAIDFARFAANVVLLAGSIGKLFGGGAAAGAAGAEGGGIASAVSAIAGPALFAIGLLATLAASFKYLYDNSEDFRKHIDDTWLGKVLPQIKENLEKLKESFDKIKENLEPIVDKLKEFADSLDLDQTSISFFELLSDTLAALLETITGIETAFAQLLSGDTQGAWETFTTTLSDDGKYLIDIFKELADVLTAPLLPLKILGEKLFEWVDKTVLKLTNGKISISGILDEIRDKFVNTFANIKEGIRGHINDMLTYVENLINGVVDGFNALGNALNGFSFDVPDTLANIVGLPTEFTINLPTLGHISLPRLAKGAVIPPNNEFLAVLGDQKRGTNIEAPLDTMVEAFNMANRGGNEAEIALLQEQNDLLRQLLDKEFGITEGDIFRSVRSQNNIYRKSTGVSAFA